MKARKYFAWFIISCLSVFFAETISGSNMLPFTDLWGLLVLIPLYGLHTIVFFTVLKRWGRPTMYTLFLAGAIYGLYEAYLTHVIWDAPWGGVVIAGVGVFETPILVFFYHAVFAFIVPLVLAEILLFRRRTLANEFRGLLEKFPLRFFRNIRSKRSILISFGILCGLIQAMNSPTPQASIASILVTGGIIALLITIWDQATVKKRITFEDVLPTRTEFIVLLTLLAGYYFWLGALVVPSLSPMPSIGAQSTIWIFYLVIGTLLYIHMHRARATDTPQTTEITSFVTTQQILIFIVATAATSALLSAVEPFASMITLTIFAIGVFMGFRVFVEAIQLVAPKKKPPQDAGV